MHNTCSTCIHFLFHNKLNYSVWKNCSVWCTTRVSPWACLTSHSFFHSLLYSVQDCGAMYKVYICMLYTPNNLTWLNLQSLEDLRHQRILRTSYTLYNQDDLHVLHCHTIKEPVLAGVDATVFVWRCGHTCLAQIPNIYCCTSSPQCHPWFLLGESDYFGAELYSSPQLVLRIMVEQFSSYWGI